MKKPLRFTHPQELQALGSQIQRVLDNCTDKPGTMGFVLLMFPYSEESTFGDYLATCTQESVPKVLREAARSMENQQGDTNVTKQ